MAETEFPVTANNNEEEQQAGDTSALALTDETAAGGESLSEEFNAIPTDDGPAETTAQGLMGKVQDFIHNGEALRKIVILGFVILFLTVAIFGLISIQSNTSEATQRQLGKYTPQEIGEVLDFLNLEGYQYNLQGDIITVDVNDYPAIKELMLRRGIALAATPTDEGDEILMTDSGFGISQRLEGERIKHGREVQLARAIERIEGVEHATVLLAIPKENVFARQKSRPSAAVVVTLRQDSYLSPENVNSIRFMVASSVQNLLSKDVTVTDQNGRLLSSMGATGNTEQDKLQREFEMRTLREAQYRDKLETILAPMLGRGNYSAEVDLTLDTTIEEETRQLYNPDSQSVRSETLREQKGSDEQTNPYGVPGSLSNQPPANAVIPQQLKDGTATAADANAKQKETREAVRNYEVDTTIRHTIRPRNAVTRLTVSVAVDYIRAPNEQGVMSWQPRSQEDLDKIAEIVRGGLGLDERRGDFVKVETVNFPHEEEEEPKAWWQQDSFYRIARIVGAVLVILVLVVFIIRPMVNKLIHGKSAEDVELESLDFDAESALEGNDDLNLIASQGDRADQVYSINREGGIELPNLHKNQDLLKAVRTLVSNEPALSSEVVKEWINSEIEKKEKAS